MQALRILGFGGLLVAAVFMWSRGVTSATSAGYDAQISSALSGANGAPEQAVAYGWVARDLLALIARGQSAVLAQVLLVVAAIMWHRWTFQRSRPDVVIWSADPATPAPVGAPGPIS